MTLVRKARGKENIGPEAESKVRSLESAPAWGLETMLAFADWFPLLVVGVTFTLLGVLKLWGLRRGLLGGRGKPALERLCGA